MNVQDLLMEQGVLNDTIYQLRNQILEEEIKQAQYECDLWVNTDFKGLKLTNKEMRDAYIKQQMGQYISNIGHLRNDLKLAESELTLNKTKIKVILELGIDLDVPGQSE